jgi:hypothetical protein
VGDHLIVMYSAVRGLPGYDRHETPSMLLEGTSMARDSEHGRAVTAQLSRRHGTLEEAIDAGTFALSAAGLSKGIRRQARAACEDYFYSRLGLTPDQALDGRLPLADSLEPLGDPFVKALENVVELVVDGDYEELRELSHDRLEIEDLERRLEEEFPESLILPPREAYRVEAITRSDEPDFPGWTYFLDLWTETGPSRLHIEGALVEEGDRMLVTLADILP